MKWAGHVERMEAMRNTYKILVGKPERKKPLARSKDGKIILKWIIEK
jgi:hypothetical protein